MIRAALASLAVGLSLVTAAPAQQRVVNVYNWSDYVDPKMLEEFTQETGIKVVYDTYDNNEIVETKLLAGKSGYDIVVPSGPFLQRLISAKVFQKLDKAKLPNLSNMWPEIQQRLAVFDPGNQYAVNYMWGTTGIGINVKKVRESARRHAAQHLGSRDEAGHRGEAEGVRHLHARSPGGPVSRRTRLSRPQSGFEAQRRSEEGRRGALPGSRQHPEIPLVRIHQRARERRHLRRRRLFGRHHPGPQARRGGEERRRDPVS